MNTGAIRLRTVLLVILGVALLSALALAALTQARDAVGDRAQESALLSAARLLRQSSPHPTVDVDSPWRISWYDAEGALISDSAFSQGRFTEADSQPELDDARRTGEGVAHRYSSVAGRETLFVAVQLPPSSSGAAYLRLAEPLHRDSPEWLLSSTFFLGLQLTMALGWGLMFWWSRRDSSQKVAQLLQRGMSFARGEDLEREYVHGAAPWPLVSTTLNRMYDLVDLRLSRFRQERDEQAAILNGMVEAVIVLDNQLQIKDMNPAARRVFPSSRPPEGLSLIEVTRSSALDDLARELQRLGDLSRRGEIVLADLETTLQVQGASLRSPAGEAWGLVLVMSDITQLKRLEIMRRDFVANVSHELKTPITNIKGYVETLLEDSVPPEKATQFLGVIGRHATRLSLIVDDLLILTRLENSPPEEGELRPVRVGDLIDGIVSQTAERASVARVRIEVRIPKKPVVVTAFPLLLEQAVLNLVDNAIKFCPPQSVIRLKVRLDNNYVELEVRDNGPGIPEREQQRVFERFYRATEGRSREGTGLGLSIVKHIVHIHRGTITLTSPPPEEPHGTSFVLRLPQGLDATSPDATSPDATSPDAGK